MNHDLLKKRLERLCHCGLAVRLVEVRMRQLGKAGQKAVGQRLALQPVEYLA